MTHLGEAAALGTALCFAVSSLWFGWAGRRAGALAVNQFRILLATALLLALHAAAYGTPWPGAVPGARLGLLLASGAIGLVLGDVGYFHALARIGPRLASVLMATWPCMALGIAWVWHGERAGRVQLLGVAATTAGVVLVLLRPREGAAWNPDLTAAARAGAVLAGLGAASGQALGYVLARTAMLPDAAAPEGVGGLSATVVRMCAGCAGILALGALVGRPLAFRAVVRTGAARHAVLGTLVGPVAGIWLSLVAARHTETGTGAALIVTTPLFLLPIARFAYGARVGLLGLCGTLLAVAGAVVLVAG